MACGKRCLRKPPNLPAEPSCLQSSPGGQDGLRHVSFKRSLRNVSCKAKARLPNAPSTEHIAACGACSACCSIRMLISQRILCFPALLLLCGRCQGGQLWELEAVPSAALLFKASGASVPRQNELYFLLPEVVLQKFGSSREDFFLQMQGNLGSSS